MGLGLRLVPESASTIAGQVDGLMLALLLLSLFFGLLVAGLILVFAIRYRRRPTNQWPEQIRGSTRLELAWTLIPLGLALVVFVWAAELYLQIADPPANALPVYVVAKQWMWKAQHAGGQEEIDELHVPVGQPVRLTMISQDVIHDFFVPDFRVHADVLPGRYTTVWFQATQAGRYHLFCSQYCGTNHSLMTGWVYALEPKDFEAWLTNGAFLSPASKGQQVFLQVGCTTCHRNDSQRRAPVLEGLYGRPVLLTNGQTVLADDDYLRESVLDPNAKVVAGYQPIMPSFKGRLDETQLVELIAYVKSLADQPSGVPPPSEPSTSILTPVAGP